MTIKQEAKPSKAKPRRRPAPRSGALRRTVAPRAVMRSLTRGAAAKKQKTKLREKAPATRVSPLVIDVCVFSSLGCSNPTLDLAFKASAFLFVVVFQFTAFQLIFIEQFDEI